MAKRTQQPEEPRNPSNLTDGPGLIHAHAKGTALFSVSNFPVTEGWVATADIALDPDDNRRLVIMNLFLCPTGGVTALPEIPLTAQVLRSVKTGGILSQAYREFIARHDLPPTPKSLHGVPVPDDRRKADRRLKGELDKGIRRRGPKGYPDSFYRKVAVLYLSLQDAGWGHSILKQIQQKMNAPNRHNASDWVSGATKRGYLAPGRPGVAGRNPGPALGAYKPVRVPRPTSSKSTKRRA